MTKGATEPTYADYEVFIDPECTVRVTTTNGDFVLSCNDLDFTREYVVGSTYKLVDKFATYQQLKPIYLNEPLWSAINQVGNYPINSGLMDYYVKADKSTITDESNTEFDKIVYLDPQCSIPATCIQMKSGGDLGYDEVNVQYSDISDVVITYESKSYELSDGDLVLYTSIPVGEMEVSDKVYNDIQLQDSAGVYGDYIPTWDMIDNHTPNKYMNNYNTINYQNGVVKNQNGDYIDVFYKEADSSQYSLYINPSKCNDNQIEYNTTSFDSHLIKLYTVDMVVVESIETLDELPSTEKMVKVVTDQTKNGKTTYYQYKNNKWMFISNILEVLTDKDFIQLRQPLFVETNSSYMPIAVCLETANHPEYKTGGFGLISWANNQMDLTINSLKIYE
jgi:hypothetical protein